MANHSSTFSVTSRLVKTIEKLRVELNWICHSVLTEVTWQEFGKGRVLVRSSHEVEPNHSSQPSFYRILWAQVTFETRSCGQSKEYYLFYQPLMDKHTLEGRVVAERVRHGVRWNDWMIEMDWPFTIIKSRYQEPVDLADIAPLPDFKLIPREKEAEVCR